MAPLRAHDGGSTGNTFGCSLSVRIVMENGTVHELVYKEFDVCIVGPTLQYLLGTSGTVGCSSVRTSLARTPDPEQTARRPWLWSKPFIRGSRWRSNRYVRQLGLEKSDLYCWPVTCPPIRRTSPSTLVRAIDLLIDVTSARNRYTRRVRCEPQQGQSRGRS